MIEVLPVSSTGLGKGSVVSRGCGTPVDIV